MREVSYYPGCSLHGTAREYDESLRGVSDLLEIRLHELEDWTCCGASSAHCTDESLALALAGRNLAIAQRSGRELLVPCVACYHRLKIFEKEARDCPERISFPYSGEIPIRYALDFFTEQPVLAEIRQKVVRPLNGLNIACYYGCLTVRPPALTSVKEYENPKHMDVLVETLGARAIPWSYKTECCGASLVMTRTDIVRRLSGRLIKMAVEADADCIVTGCPMCQANLDMRQQEAFKSADGRTGVPVIYFTELIGIALAHKDVKKWLSRHITDALGLFEAKGII